MTIACTVRDCGYGLSHAGALAHSDAPSIFSHTSARATSTADDVGAASLWNPGGVTDNSASRMCFAPGSSATGIAARPRW